MLASSELNNSDIKRQGSDTTHTVRLLEMFNKKLKMENTSVKFLIDTGSSLNILNRKMFDKIKRRKQRKSTITKNKCQRYCIWVKPAIVANKRCGFSCG